MGCTGSKVAYETDIGPPAAPTRRRRRPSGARQQLQAPSVPTPPSPLLPSSSRIPQPTPLAERGRKSTQRTTRSSGDDPPNQPTKTVAGVGGSHNQQQHPDTDSTPERMPPIKDISRWVSKTKLQPTRYGGISDIYEGVMRPRGDEVAIKAFRFPDTFGFATGKNSLLEEVQQQLLRNTHCWAVPPHPRIALCLGYAMIDYMLCIITLWYNNGSIENYLRGNAQCDRLALITQVAEGLEYLHRRGVFHGDLKPSKILVNDQGEAIITDVGLANVLEGTRVGLLTANSSAMGIRYSAPERLLDEDGDSKSDVYSFGCVALEIMTGKAPFHSTTSPSVVAAARVKGALPSYDHGQEFTEENPLYNLLNRCWDPDASQRPTMLEVVEELRKQGVKVY